MVILSLEKKLHIMYSIYDKDPRIINVAIYRVQDAVRA